MTITYKEMRERKIKLDEKRIETMNKVEKEALTLVEKYTESLQLERDSWEDYLGNYNPYVIVGSVNSGGYFKETSITSVAIDNYNTINFTIRTVIDDTPRGGSFVPVDITLWIGDYGHTYVRIGDEVDSIRILDKNWDRACFRLKDKVYMGIAKTELTY
ncbi:hypothetical protein KKI90_07260 [Xenorhabdus bovienii]|uniref:hypothetical protein n=1 Tax=Xenorhabdus bovienii TaxID=40576 RepID=UPI00301CF37C